MDDRSPAGTQLESEPEHASTEYWCYHCDKRVEVETLADLHDVVCYECKNGFVEPIDAAAAIPATGDEVDDPTLGNQFIQVLRLIAQAARDDDAPPPPSPPPPSDPSVGDYLRIELDGWGNNDDDEEEDEADDDEEEHSVVEESESNNNNRDREIEIGIENGSDEDEIDVIGDEVDAIRQRRRDRDVLRLRLRDFASRAASRRNRILDWAEILMGLEDHSIELRLQVPDSDTYIGNPGDYVDAAGYEALLHNLAESDNNGRRGAPPAAKSAIEGLQSVTIGSEDATLSCAICKDVVNVGEVVKTLPCGHGYHCDCIIPWLGARNTCPVCRYELATDDEEYEEERKQREVGKGVGSSSSTTTGEGQESSG